MHAGVLASARVTHESGRVDDIADASPDSQRTGVADLLSSPDVEEAYVLSTCNRVEAYVVTPDAAVGRAALEDFFRDADDDTVVYADHDDSLRHLLRVAAGLESVVIGEDQIIGQVRTAYEDARCSGGIGPTLETGVTKAIHVGERARTETAINEGIVSLGSAATTLAERDVGSLEGATALVVGAGEMARLAARSLTAGGVDEVIVANRTVPHAEHVVAELDVSGQAIALAGLDTVTSRTDVVVTATGSSEPILEASHFESAGDGTTVDSTADSSGDRSTGRPQVVVDLGQPRDVCPSAGALSGLTVYDLDDLESITQDTRDQRADAAHDVEAMIDEEFENLLDQYKRTRADEAIAAMYEGADRIKHRELETALTRLESGDDEFSDGQREIVEAMADALVNQLLAPPTESLREAASDDDWSTISTALQLFDPEFGPEPPLSALESESGSETEFDLERDAETGFEAIDDD